MSNQPKLSDIKNIIKNQNPELYDKIIIADELKKNDYAIVSYSYKTISRTLCNTNIPFFKDLHRSFEKLSNEPASFQNKNFLNDNVLDENYINPYSTVIDFNSNSKELEFPIQEKNSEVLEAQGLFYLTDSIKKYSCESCNGDGLVTCDSSPCYGKHKWECDECIGEGKIYCNSCNGEGWNTCGGWFSGCDGSGKVKKRVKLANGKESEKLVNCSTCSGKGKVNCKTCNTSGKVTCPKCSGKRLLTCSKCYPDRKRYGLIDCSTCSAQGEFITFDYVNSKIEENSVRRIIPNGDNLLLKKTELENFYSQLEQEQVVFHQINDVLTNSYDGLLKPHCSSFHKEFNLKKDSFPKLLKEQISCKTVSCVEFSYTHIISNEVHKGVIININEAPELKFYTNPELIKTDLNSISKSAVNIFSKILKTKRSKLKNDRFIEIKLMIYLAKADGVMEEAEKKYLSSQIQDLKEFTNAEKKTLFNLMNMHTLPELSKKDLKFSSNQTGLEIIEKLKELALIDGEKEYSEIEFINKIKSHLDI
ncbi:hypothetical protein POV26_03640 [Aequorivita todarodis]|uniref:hypothetical protein n=1 Tax=Aequorivita todarodis TaxID=2036821 RepID=UPI002350140D|nr:hypothetical protein [Aequorivita todarodis]MDC8000116.1 hypothetical protein [Aequorivita todarodis]